MRLGLLADVHANADALRAVLSAAHEELVDQLIVAGDLIGYYYDPLEVMELLDGWEWSFVRGNHEVLLRQWLLGLGREEVHRRYGSGIAVAAQNLSPAQLKFLTDASDKIELCFEGYRVLVCHGSPWSADQYIYPDVDAGTRQRMAESGSDLVVFGHTHYPVNWEFAGTTVVNPGSVGQPRDRLPGACWAIVDTTNRQTILRREKYDCSRLLQECRERDPHLPFLADVLTRC